MEDKQPTRIIRIYPFAIDQTQEKGLFVLLKSQKINLLCELSPPFFKVEENSLDIHQLLKGLFLVSE